MTPSPRPAAPPIRRSLAARAAAAARRIGPAAAAPLLLPPPPAAPPRAGVARVPAALLQSMQNAETLGFSGRYENLAPVLKDSFDLPFMVRVSVGQYWSGLDAGQQEKLADAFERFTGATYAGRFDGYSGARFEVGGGEPGPR